MLSLAMVAPFLYMVAASLWGEPGVLTPRWSNYRAALTALPFDRFFLNSALFARRVVESTVMFRCLARTAAAMPTEDVPPRMRMDCPGRESRPTVSEPYAVCSISGKAPSVDHSRSLANGITWRAGTQVYSA